MRHHIRAFTAKAEAIFNFPQPVVEVGSFQVPGQEDIADMRLFFRGKAFIGCDMREGKGVDRIEDVENLSFNKDTIGTVLLLDTLEHVRNPIRAMQEVWRVLMPEGYVLYTSVMDFPIHDYPYDYWRFTPEAFNLLCERFPNRAIIWWGNPQFPHTIISIASKSNESDSFTDKIMELIRGMPQILTITLKRKLKLILAKKLRMNKTFEELKGINQIGYKIYEGGKIFKERKEI